MSANANEIDLITAQKWCKNWRVFFHEQFPDVENKDIFRGFYIPMIDIIELAQNHVEAMGVRGYIAMTEENELGSLRFVLVPVIPGIAGHSNGTDHIVNNVPSPGGETSYSIYDFTRPCPLQCDTASPLYDEEQEKGHKGHKDHKDDKDHKGHKAKD